MLQYKGYAGHVEFDDEIGIFHGEVLDLRDVITFQGKSVEEIERAFRCCFRQSDGGFAAREGNLPEHHPEAWT